MSLSSVGAMLQRLISTLAPAIAVRSAKLFFYLQQCFAKWDRGLELLRSVSKRHSGRL